jgi:hypothetical protein
MFDDVHTQIEVGGQPPHDGELLVVLLAEHGHMWTGGSQEFGDHRGHAVEVSRACSAFHCRGQARHPHGGGEPFRIHRRCRRDEDDVDALGVAGAQVVVEWPWVVIEVALFPELERIDEDRHDNCVRKLTCSANQLDVTAMQRPHRRDQSDRAAGRTGRIGPGAHGGRVVERGGHVGDASARSVPDRRGRDQVDAVRRTAGRRSTRRWHRSWSPRARHGCMPTQRSRLRPAGSD